MKACALFCNSSRTEAVTGFSARLFPGRATLPPSDFRQRRLVELGDVNGVSWEFRAEGSSGV